MSFSIKKYWYDLDVKIKDVKTVDRYMLKKSEGHLMSSYQQKYILITLNNDYAKIVFRMIFAQVIADHKFEMQLEGNIIKLYDETDFGSNDRKIASILIEMLTTAGANFTVENRVTLGYALNPEDYEEIKAYFVSKNIIKS